MVKWVQSTAVFRAWAEEWVLAPREESVLRLPILDHFLFVSVSPTLGVVRHSWFHAKGFVYGSVGNNGMILRKSRVIEGSQLIEDAIEEVGAGDGDALKPVLLLETPYNSMYCNRKWIVGIQEKMGMHVWQVSVVGDASSSGTAKMPWHFDGLQVGYGVWACFSPFCDDVFLVFDSGETGGSVEFCDLQASVNEGKLVVIRNVLCSERFPRGIIWRPDGSVCTMHYDPCLIVDNATGARIEVHFPVGATVIPVGSRHIFVMRKGVEKYEVYHNGGLTSAPTLSVPCTWAAPSIGVQSQLIVSTTHNPETHSSATEIKFAVHDCSTGFHVGDFSVPCDPLGILEKFNVQCAGTLHPDTEITCNVTQQLQALHTVNDPKVAGLEKLLKSSESDKQTTGIESQIKRVILLHSVVCGFPKGTVEPNEIQMQKKCR
ncbi:hypothetical protein Pelo_4259 [Pelomyxa schiedti]|nr:hypothetical protein Pelo_4259 [Pelomyxa schiedti]